MMKRKRPGYWWAWVDSLYATLGGYMVLVLAAVLLMNPPQQAKPGVEMKAEFLIKMSWPDGNLDDIDVHMRLPSGKMLNFSNREVEYALLDHDDVGVNGRYKISDRWVHIREHLEIISVRAIVPGTYVVNLHVFRENKKLTESGEVLESTPQLPYPVHVTLIKLNPRVEELAAVDVVMSEVGQQRTAFAFTVLENGQATVDKESDMPFIPVVKPSGAGER
jgi:hypothetical protein